MAGERAQLAEVERREGERRRAAPSVPARSAYPVGGSAACSRPPSAPRQPAVPGLRSVRSAWSGAWAGARRESRSWDHAAKHDGAGGDSGSPIGLRSGNNRGSFPRLTVCPSETGSRPRFREGDRPSTDRAPTEQRQQRSDRTGGTWSREPPPPPPQTRRAPRPRADALRNRERIVGGRPGDVRRVRPRGPARRDRPPGRRRQRHPLPELRGPRGPRPRGRPRRHGPYGRARGRGRAAEEPRRLRRR